MKYVMITPARDEAAYIEKTILSVAAQSIRPTQWIVVDDGSRDDTGAIIDHYARSYSWLTPVHRANRGFREAGGGVMKTFYDGYAQIRSSDWDFVVKLDADLTFSPDYFERCFAEFELDPQLGIGGGGIYHLESGSLKLEENPLFHVRGATKIYRRACWDQLGGLIRAPGWDTVDELKANMLGWRTRSFIDLKVLHHRLTGAANGTWGECVKNGKANYIAGYHPAFMMFKCLRRVAKRPFLVGTAGLSWGYLSALWKRTPQIDDLALIQYTRRQQIRK